MTSNMNVDNDERHAHIGRRQLRGKPLLEGCARAHISHNELPGVDACYGLTDYNPGIYNDECLECGALVWGDRFDKLVLAERIHSMAQKEGER